MCRTLPKLEWTPARRGDADHPLSMVRRPWCGEGTAIAQGLVARKQQGWHWSPGLLDLRLYPLPWHFVCSDSVYLPSNPVEVAGGFIPFSPWAVTPKVTEAQRGEVLCSGSHSMCVWTYIPYSDQLAPPLMTLTSPRGKLICPKEEVGQGLGPLGSAGPGRRLWGRWDLRWADGSRWAWGAASLPPPHMGTAARRAC